MMNEDVGMKRLAAGIYTQAIVDYVKYGIKLKHLSHGTKSWQYHKNMTDSCRTFIYSEWAEWLAEYAEIAVNADKLIKQLDKYIASHDKLTMGQFEREVNA